MPLHKLPLASSRATVGSRMWHPEIPTLQLSWDATSIKEIQHCPRKYFYSIVLGFKTEKESHHLSFGRKYHSCLEVYDKSLANGLDWEEAQDLTMQRVFKECHGYDSGDKVKQRFSLWRTVQWYTESFKPDNDSVKPIKDKSGRHLIELPFNFTLPMTSPGGQDYIACGYFDGIVEAMGATFVRERKTTGKTLNADWFNTFGVDAQIDMYSVASKIVFEVPVRGVLIDGAQVTYNFSRFGRYPSMRTEPQQEEFLQDLQYWIFQAETCATEGFWPKATRFCFWCPFQSVCSKDPASRTGVLLGEFRIEDWDPTLDRVDT